MYTELLLVTTFNDKRVVVLTDDILMIGAEAARDHYVLVIATTIRLTKCKLPVAHWKEILSIFKV